MMNKRWVKIVGAVLCILGILGFLISLQPDTYAVERTTTIAAPPPAVFEHINDFHKWEAWSPWLKLDPNSKNTYEGAAAGEGAVFKWDGNDQVGAGQMTLLESKPAEHVHIKLDFIRPMEDTADVHFHLTPKDGNQTDVSWKMEGKHNFMSKAMCLFMSMDKMIGGDFEKGLASMKAAVEGSAKPAPAPAPPAPPEAPPASAPAAPAEAAPAAPAGPAGANNTDVYRALFAWQRAELAIEQAKLELRQAEKKMEMAYADFKATEAAAKAHRKVDAPPDAR